MKGKYALLAATIYNYIIRALKGTTRQLIEDWPNLHWPLSGNWSWSGQNSNFRFLLVFTKRRYYNRVHALEKYIIIGIQESMRFSNLTRRKQYSLRKILETLFVMWKNWGTYNQRSVSAGWISITGSYKYILSSLPAGAYDLGQSEDSVQGADFYCYCAN